MGIRVAWSLEAADDLEEIATYIARDSAAYARTLVTMILAVSKSLAQFPEIGRIVPEVGDSAIRERFVYSFRLIYRIERHRVLTLAIWHGKRLLHDIEDRVPPS